MGSNILCSILFGKLLIQTINVAPLTLPFNFSTLILMSATSIGFASSPPPSPEQLAADTTLSLLYFVQATLRGVSQVFLSDNVWVALAMVLGVLVSSRLMALYFLLGSLAGVGVGFALGRSRADIGAGIYGFNAGAVSENSFVKFFTLFLTNMSAFSVGCWRRCVLCARAAKKRAVAYRQRRILHAAVCRHPTTKVNDECQRFVMLSKN